MIRSISLQFKLIALVSIVIIALTGIIVAFHSQSLQQSVRQTFFSQMTGITTAINGRYEESRSTEDIQQMFDYIQLRNANVLELTLHGNDWKIHASTDRRLIGNSSPQYVGNTLTESKTFVDQQLLKGGSPKVRLMAPLFEDGVTQGAIELLLDASNEEALIRKNMMTSIMLGILCDIGFVIILWFSLRKLLVRPLLTLRQAAIAIKLGARTQKLQLSASLEITEVADAFNDMVENLDARYNELQQALLTLQNTQEQLVQAEKMSALGRLVAGVAHEINTPLGVGVTAVSYLEQRTKDFVELYEQNRLKKSDLESFIKSAQETVGMIQTNLSRASELIRSFKQVSVDQSNEEIRTFRLLDYIEDILRSLQPTIKKTRQRTAVLGDRDLEISTYPGVVSQIVTNLVMNSLTHAYEPDDEGNMMISVERRKSRLLVHYADDGKGMPKDVADKIFDPFFTTNRSRGGTGLGMNIVYNLVTQKLGGTIQCFSEPGRGTAFIIEIPFRKEEPHEQQSA